MQSNQIGHEQVRRGGGFGTLIRVTSSSLSALEAVMRPEGTPIMKPLQHHLTELPHDESS